VGLLTPKGSETIKAIISPPSAALPRVSTMIRNSIVRAAFERAERDEGHAFCTTAERPRMLNGGAAELVPEPTDETLSSLRLNRLEIAYA
jgi:hypothetical protein